MQFKAIIFLVLSTLSTAQVKSKPKFTSNLITRTFSQHTGNLIFSPFSVLANLAIIYQASSQHTYDAFTNTLGVSNTRNFSELFQKIITSLNNADGVILETANKIYIADKFKIDVTFANIARSNFFTEIENVDFSEAERKINDWIRNKTNGKIMRLITQNDFDELTTLVLINAIYFKSAWRYRFNEQDTSKQLFFLNDENESKLVDMMQLRANVGYGENSNLDAKLLELPYRNKKISMVIVLPNKKSGIVELQQKLAAFNIDEVISNIAVSPVLIKIPKFKIESTFDLKQLLSEMGLEEIFTINADFSGMLENKLVEQGLYVNKIVQKTFIEVNEEGSEVAAATALSVQTRRSGAKSHESYTFIADHPFIFLVIYRQKFGTGILFSGRINDL